MSGDLLALVVVGVVSALLALAGPRVLAQLPEPDPEPQPEPQPGVDPDPSAAPTVEDEVGAKELYREIAALPRLRRGLALTSLVAGALVGWRIGWVGAVPLWCFLVPLSVLLSVVDWRTRLLPTKIIAPSYAVVVALVLVAAGLDRSLGVLVHAALGWLVMGGVFVVLWLVYPRGMGYGDVRFSGILGLALGVLGWPQLLTGLYASFLIGGVGGLLLSRIGRVSRRNYPFGPFMAFGALVGVVVGVPLVHALGY